MHTHPWDYYHSISAKPWSLTFLVEQPQNRFSINNHRRTKSNNNACHSAIVLIHWMQFAPDLAYMLAYIHFHEALNRDALPSMDKPGCGY